MQKIIIGFLILFFTGTSLSAPESLTWQKVFQMIADRFPNLPEISVSELAHYLEDNTPLYLIDARTKKEFQVSHIKNALNLTTVADIKTQVHNKKALVIVYCSVGYRSAVLVADLRAKGYHNSFNLKGSIFEWANSGHKVYQNDKETHRVHPYNQKWGVLLKKEYHYENRWIWW